MSTNDVPGANPRNGDILAMGCWAEHEDGSLLVVESTEASRVVYSMFDMSKDPIVEYRDAMPEAQFKRQFSWKGDDDELWTWHDKTPFDWDRVIEAGAQDGLRFASVHGLSTAARRVAESLHLRGEQIRRDYSHRRDQVRSRVSSLMDKFSRAISELRK